MHHFSNIQLVVGPVLCFLFFLAAQLMVYRIASRNAALIPWRPLLLMYVVVWFVIGLLKARYNDEYGWVLDSVTHDEAARLRAGQILHGDWKVLLQEFSVNNTGFQMLLGAVYALVGSPPPFTGYLANTGIACVSLALLLELMCIHTDCRRIPWFILTGTMLLPTALFWATAINKESLMLLAISWMLRLVPYASAPFKTGPASPLAWCGVVLATFIRPHVALCWFTGILGGIVIGQKRYVLGAIGSVALLLMLLAFNHFRSDLVQKMLDEGVTDTMANYQGGNWGGNSQIVRKQNPIPFVEGLGMLFLRPFPNEINGTAALLASLEVWLITAVTLTGWVMARNRRSSLSLPISQATLASILCLSFFFSYMLNLGYMSRQRLQAFPAILLIASVPYLANPQRRRMIRTVESRPSAPPFSRPSFATNTVTASKRTSIGSRGQSDSDLGRG